MPVDAKLLEILCCPVSKSPLLRLGGDRLENLNRMISAREVLYVDGRTVTGLLQEGPSMDPATAPATHEIDSRHGYAMLLMVPSGRPGTLTTLSTRVTRTLV